MESEKHFDILTQHILHIFDMDGNEIPFKELKIVKEVRKYSNVVSPILYADDKPIKSKTHKVQYQCRCGRTPTIFLCKYLVKPNIVCPSCLQDSKFEDRVIANPGGPRGRIPEDRKPFKKPKNEHLCFENETEEFKEQYKTSHITNEEMIEWWPYIYRINGYEPIKDNLTYFYAVPTNNQMKYTSMISVDDGKTLIPNLTIELKCSICGKVFKIHKNNLRKKNKHSIKCCQCALCNTSFPLKAYGTSGLTYQSSSELEFIQLCEKNNIKVLNGFEIPYFRNGRRHTYVSDFYLPELKTIVEIKGNNVYYRMELKSGKFQAKCEGAKEFSRNNNMKYDVVFAENVSTYVSSLIDERDSLNNGESH